MCVCISLFSVDKEGIINSKNKHTTTSNRTVWELRHRVKQSWSQCNVALLLCSKEGKAVCWPWSGLQLQTGDLLSPNQQPAESLRLTSNWQKHHWLLPDCPFCGRRFRMKIWTQTHTWGHCSDAAHLTERWVTVSLWSALRVREREIFRGSQCYCQTY